MKKRYQVFVSSTYEDLKQERNEAMKVLLELDCIPTAMELFPATDESSWSYIKGVIEECDYYILIVGGRYGSVDTDGISFTEKEYRYAASKEKPRIVFIPENFDDIPAGKTENDPTKKKKLQDFISFLLPERNYKKWSNPDNLGSVLSRSMTQLIKSRPATGWVRANEVGSVEQKDEIIRLRSKLEELESKLKELETPGLNTEDLAFGSDPYEIDYVLSLRPVSSKDPRPTVKKERHLTLSWDTIFEAMAPHMLVFFPVSLLISKLRAQCVSIDADWIKSKTPEGYQRQTITFSPKCTNEIKIQLMSLDLIEEIMDEDKKNRFYWKLTPKGESYLKERMISRKPKKQNK